MDISALAALESVGHHILIYENDTFANCATVELLRAAGITVDLIGNLDDCEVW